MTANPAEAEPILLPEVPQGSRFRRAHWRPRDAAVGVGITLLAAALAVLYLIDPGPFQQIPFVILAVLNSVIELIVFLALPLYLLRKRSGPPNPKLWSVGALAKEFLIAIPLTIGVMICTAIAGYSAQYVLTKLGHPTESAPEFWGRLAELGVILVAFLAVLIAPVTEEVFFRGFLYNSLRRVCPGWIAAFAQAALFGVGHVYEPLGVFVSFVIGLLLAAVYEWRKTLLATVLVHGMYNSIAILAIATAVIANAKAPMLGVACSPNVNDRAVVDKVIPGSPAEKSDIRPGDVIIRYNRYGVTDGGQLIRLVRAGKVGDESTVEIIRGEARIRKRVALRSHADLE